MRRFLAALVLLAVFSPCRNALGGYLSFLADPNSPATAPDNLVTLTPGQATTIALFLVNDTASPLSFLSIDTALRLDAATFTISNARVGDLTSSFSGLFSINGGEIDGTQSSATGATLPARPGNDGTFSIDSVLLFDVQASATAAPGDYALNLLAQGSTVTTAIDEGLVPLEPSPTNAPDDPKIDGLIRISGGVPEPSSVVLFGLGAMLMGIALRCRRSACPRVTEGGA